MTQELAHEILRQANELAVAQREEAASRSAALLNVWSWRGKYHAEVNTKFCKHWSVRKTTRGELVIAGNGYDFPNYGFPVAQHLAKTFLYEREDDALGNDRLEFADKCQPYDNNGPRHVDYKDAENMLHSLKLGKVQVEVYKLPANLPLEQLHTVKTEYNTLFRRFSAAAVGASKLAECIDEVLQLYLLANFSQA